MEKETALIKQQTQYLHFQSILYPSTPSQQPITIYLQSSPHSFELLVEFRLKHFECLENLEKSFIFKNCICI